MSSGGWEQDRHGNVYPTLEGAASDWRTPSDLSKRGGSQSPEKRQAGGHTVNLEDQAEHWSKPDWATPCARDHMPAHDPAYIAEKKAQGHGMRNLTDEAAQWETPSVAVVDGTRMTRGGDRSGELLLTGQAAALAMKADQWTTPCADDTGTRMKRYGQGGTALSMQADQWPTPAALDHKGINSPEHVMTENGTGRMHLKQLPNFVEYRFLPPSSPAPATPADGSTCSTAIPNTSPPSVKRKLNPIFVEALMRWPTGLSGFERAETAWTRWSQLQRPYVFGLCSIEDEAPAQGLLL